MIRPWKFGCKRAQLSLSYRRSSEGTGLNFSDTMSDCRVLQLFSLGVSSFQKSIDRTYVFVFVIQIEDSALLSWRTKTPLCLPNAANCWLYFRAISSAIFGGYLACNATCARADGPQCGISSLASQSAPVFASRALSVRLAPTAMWWNPALCCWRSSAFQWS